jgi:predicted DNA-binding transcriptional regulator AlpA
MEYTFTLRYKLADSHQEPDELVECLADAGCDDALVGIGQRGYLALEFTREAPNALEAFRTALADVKVAIPEAVLIEAAPDFVGLSDVADLVGVTRQNMRKLMLSHADTFPPPVHGGSTMIWHLDDVLDWLSARSRYPVAQTTLETARLLRQLNLAREMRYLKPEVVRTLDTDLA